MQAVLDEIRNFLAHQPAGEYLSRWIIRDHVRYGPIETRDCSEAELEAAIQAIEGEYGISIPEGSMGEHIHSSTPSELIAKHLETHAKGPANMTRLDELELLKRSR